MNWLPLIAALGALLLHIPTWVAIAKLRRKAVADERRERIG